MMELIIVQIIYQVNQAITSQQFKQLLQDSTLGQRRPIDDEQCLQGMVANSNLMISAWYEQRLVGIARSVTDFHYCCYLSDLAVHQDFQHLGIGKQLQHLTQQQLGPKCKIILLAAPAAKDYYQHIGYNHNERCWVLDREYSLNSSSTED